MSDSQPDHPSPWHAGEIEMQQHAGVAERMHSIGAKVIRDHMPDQHREFYERLSYLVVGAVDEQGWPWASLIDAEAGFITSPHSGQLDIAKLPDHEDPLGSALTPGAAVGLLGIDLHTRRRNRMNGRVRRLDERGFSVSVEQAFGNCPQYIQLRERIQSSLPAHTAPARAERMNSLDRAAADLVRSADTFFVASYADRHEADAVGQTRRSVDVSHRGGQAGFVRVEGNVLTIPDFAGNRFFNTLGNFALNPRAGLVFIDFDSGDVLQLAGCVTLMLEGAEVQAFEGAERLWQVDVQAVVRRPAALRTHWLLKGFSPASLATGTWEQSADR